MSVSIMLVRALVDAIEPGGIDRNELLRAARFDPRRLEQIDERLDLHEYDRVQEAALDLTGDEALGLHLGEQANPAAFDVIGHLTSHAPTLKGGFECFLRFQRILSDRPDSVLYEQGDTATLRYEFPRSQPRYNRLRAEFAMSGFLRLIRHFAGHDATPRHVFFEHPPPEHRAEYTRIFAGAERFGHGFTGMEFDRAWLQRSGLHKNADLYSVLETQAERRLVRLAKAAGHAERLKECLLAHAPAQKPDMQAIALELGMSVRSLRRRLTEEGASYPELVSQTRAILAKRMLDDPRRSIHETAYAMGFSDPSAFYRAFKRWTGMTPNQYRGTCWTH